MYNEFYGLYENPFSISPDPKYFYLSERHNQAFAHLSYGIKSGGAFVLLTGEVGTGKTTVSRRILNILPENTALASIYHPTDEPRELYACICDEFKITYGKSSTIKDLFNLLKDFFFNIASNGRHAVIVIDEAQMLSEESLEQLRLLTNLETDNSKVVQIVLIGQPELQTLLSRQSLRQLSQRITARFHITPLDLNDVGAYIRFRLQIAGRIQPLFDASAIKAIAKYTSGVPRLINLVADRSIEEGTTTQSRLITSKEVKKAICFIEPKYKSKSNLGNAIVCFFEKIHFSTKIFWYFIPVILGVLLSMITGPIIPIEEPKAQVDIEVIDNHESYQKSKDDKQEYFNSIRNASAKDEAISMLFKVWGYADSSANCDNASLVNLFCYDYSGDLKHFVSYNHPAVVRLYDENLIEFYGVIIGFNDSIARVIIDNNLYEFDRPFFEKMWDGEALIISRLFPSGSLKLLRNSSEADFKYISLALSRALKKKIINYKNYSSQLTEDVKNFQKKEGLGADGIVGTKTLLLLNARGGTNMNHLSDVFDD